MNEARLKRQLDTESTSLSSLHYMTINTCMVRSPGFSDANTIAIFRACSIFSSALWKSCKNRQNTNLSLSKIGVASSRTTKCLHRHMWFEGYVGEKILGELIGATKVLAKNSSWWKTRDFWQQLTIYSNLHVIRQMITKLSHHTKCMLVVSNSCEKFQRWIHRIFWEIDQ